MIPPTVENDLWCLSLRQTGLDLEPVSVVFRVVSTQNLRSWSDLSRARSQGRELWKMRLLAMQPISILYDENWLNGAAGLLQLRLDIVAGAAGMTLNTMTDCAVR